MQARLTAYPPDQAAISCPLDPGGTLRIGRGRRRRLAARPPFDFPRARRTALRATARWRLRDLDSKNGSFVDGIRVDDSRAGRASLVAPGRRLLRVRPARATRSRRRRRPASAQRARPRHCAAPRDWMALQRLDDLLDASLRGVVELAQCERGFVLLAAGRALRDPRQPGAGSGATASPTRFPAASARSGARCERAQAAWWSTTSALDPWLGVARIGGRRRPQRAGLPAAARWRARARRDLRRPHAPGPARSPRWTSNCWKPSPKPPRCGSRRAATATCSPAAQRRTAMGCDRRRAWATRRESGTDDRTATPPRPGRSAMPTCRPARVLGERYPHRIAPRRRRHGRGLSRHRPGPRRAGRAEAAAPGTGAPRRMPSSASARNCCSRARCRIRTSCASTTSPSTTTAG